MILFLKFHELNVSCWAPQSRKMNPLFSAVTELVLVHKELKKIQKERIKERVKRLDKKENVVFLGLVSAFF